MSAFPRPLVSTPTRPIALVQPAASGVAPIPLELTYTGIRDGKHVWSSMTPLSPTDRVTFDHMPHATSVVFPRTN